MELTKASNKSLTGPEYKDDESRRFVGQRRHCHSNVMACVRIRRGGQLGQSLETLDFQLDCWGPNHSVSGTSENSCRDQEDGQKDQAESK